MCPRRAGGLAALWPKSKRPPQTPNATPTHVIEVMLTLALVQPTLGFRQYADRLCERGFKISKSTVQNHLVAHGLGKRHQRLGRSAAIAAMTTGTITTIDRHREPLGFCHWAPDPAALLSVDSFYIGNLKGVGKVYQLTAVDTFTRWAMAWIIAGTVNADMSIKFLARIHRGWARLGFPIRAVVADNGPEYKATAFCEALTAKQIKRVWIPPRSPNHNAIVERFQQTMLNECWRPAFHRRHYTSINQLQTEADAWLTTYKTRRPNHGNYMNGRRPIDLLPPTK